MKTAIIIIMSVAKMKLQFIWVSYIFVFYSGWKFFRPRKIHPFPFATVFATTFCRNKIVLIAHYGSERTVFSSNSKFMLPYREIFLVSFSLFFFYFFQLWRHSDFFPNFLVLAIIKTNDYIPNRCINKIRTFYRIRDFKEKLSQVLLLLRLLEKFSFTLI